jgi:hypothetical protein
MTIMDVPSERYFRRLLTTSLMEQDAMTSTYIRYISMVLAAISYMICMIHEVPGTIAAHVRSVNSSAHKMKILTVFDPNFLVYSSTSRSSVATLL